MAEVIWHKKAEKVFDNMVSYLENEVSLTSSQNLVRAMFMAIVRIREHPTLGRPSSQNREVRFVLIGRHRRLYYRVKGKKIVVIFLFDTRQEPQKDPYQK